MDIVQVFHAIVLGIVQGVTEFIPISSSAHLIIVPWLFNWDEPLVTSLSFDVALHLGTLLAVLWFFAHEWVCLIKAWFASVRQRRIGDDPDRRLAWLLIIGCIPGAIAGVLGESKIEQLFHRANEPITSAAMIVMAIIIALAGTLMYLADKLATHRRGMDSLSIKDAIVVGLAQALAIFPGVSRSGSTITAGLALAQKRETAARFSFLLSAPIIAGAGLKSLADVYHLLKVDASMKSQLIYFPIGFAAAAISGYFCIRFMLRYLQNHTINVFAYYRWALAVLIVVVAVMRPVA
jgi:undecaprenyl-diphosphatase